MTRKRNKISKFVRADVLKKTNGRCAYCGCDLIGKWVVDHIFPVARGGCDDYKNLHASCFACNSFKTSFTIEEFRLEVTKQAERAERYCRNVRMALRYGLLEIKVKEIKFYFECL